MPRKNVRKQKQRSGSPGVALLLVLKMVVPQYPLFIECLTDYNAN